MRPMVLDYWERPELRVAELQYLLGEVLLVAPFCEPGERRTVWFPPGSWAYYASGEVVRGPQFKTVEVPLAEAPLWLRLGSVIPLTTPRRRISHGAYEDLTLVLVPDEQGMVPSSHWPGPPLFGGAEIDWVAEEPARVAVRVPANLPAVKVVVMGTWEGSFEANGERSPRPGGAAHVAPRRVVAGFGVEAGEIRSTPSSSGALEAALWPWRCLEHVIVERVDRQVTTAVDPASETAKGGQHAGHGGVGPAAFGRCHCADEDLFGQVAQGEHRDEGLVVRGTPSLGLGDHKAQRSISEIAARSPW